MPGNNEPSGFIMTTILGIVGAFVASYLGQALNWYKAGESAGIGQSSAAHAAFALRLKARPSGILIFEATMRSLLLRPGDS